MHIHLPKPLHGWREFASEIVIIVIGVLIALSLEQAVEAFHERNVSAEAREAIRAELENNIAEIAPERRARACVERRLEEIGALLDAAARGQRFRPAVWIGRPRILTPVTARWEAATQAGRTSLLPSREQAGYGEVYERMGKVIEQQNDEQREWAELRTLEGRQTVTPEEIVRLRTVLSSAKYHDWLINVTIRRAADAATAVHIKPTRNYHAMAQSRIVPACLPIQTPKSRAIAILQNPVGEPD